jgi:hypothetical protein
MILRIVTTEHLFRELRELALRDLLAPLLHKVQGLLIASAIALGLQ